MICYIIGCWAPVSHSARHRRFGLVVTCKRHDPTAGGLGLPVVLSGPVLPAPARGVVRMIDHAWTDPDGSGAPDNPGPRVPAPPPISVAGSWTCRVLGCPAPVQHRGALCDRCAGGFGDRVPAPPPPPVQPPQGPAVSTPVAPRSPALPAEVLRAPARDATALIAF